MRRARMVAEHLSHSPGGAQLQAAAAAEEILYTQQGAHATLTLNRPEKLNSITLGMVHGLVHACTLPSKKALCLSAPLRPCRSVSLSVALSLCLAPVIKPRCLATHLPAILYREFPPWGAGMSRSRHPVGGPS